ncbi:hypothetical protein AUR63_05520 [Guyparkeria sp. XI15]|nr:hypothetical protein AUR63_05520 [Guyparkeria sp. XI15]OAE85136.1 hypothetical protein AWR35_05530 [Guyparkeria sp. WRN-7]
MFVFIVIDFIALTPPNFLIAIIAIILSRQLMTQTALVLRNMAFLVQQKQKITALFFHDTQLDEQPHTADASVWHLLEDNTLASWIDYLKERLRPNTLDSDYDTNWVQTNVPNVMGIEVHWRLFGFSILIKVFEKNRTASATHETTLLLDRPNNIPAPPLLLAEKKDGFSYLVFDITGYRPAHLIPHLKAQKEITKQLLFTEPSPDMEKRYRRSRKMLWEKLDRSFFSRLNLIADDKQQSDLTTLRSNLTRVQETLRKHALQIHTSIPSPPGSGLFYRSHDERLVLAHWAHWKAEPQGSGWPVKSATDLEDLGELIKAGYTATNSKNVEATVTSCKIAACTNAMIREYEQQRYQSSFVFLRLLIELI